MPGTRHLCEVGSSYLQHNGRKLAPGWIKLDFPTPRVDGSSRARAVTPRSGLEDGVAACVEGDHGKSPEGPSLASLLS